MLLNAVFVYFTTLETFFQTFKIKNGTIEPGLLTIQERRKIPSLFYDKKMLRKSYVTDLAEVLKKIIFSSTENI